MDFQTRARFDRELSRRLERQQLRLLVAVPALATLALALVAWLAFPWPTALTHQELELDTPLGVARIEETAHEGVSEADQDEPSWAWEVFESPEHLDGLYADDDELLPDDYEFIATVILGGEV
jgi:hypothetical protein